MSELFKKLKQNIVIFKLIKLKSVKCIHCLVGDIQKNHFLQVSCFQGFPCDSAGKESACNAGGLGSIPGLGRSTGEGKGYPLHNSGLDNSMDFIAHAVAKSQTRLSDFYFHFLSRMLLANWIISTALPSSLSGSILINIYLRKCVV